MSQSSENICQPEIEPSSSIVQPPSPVISDKDSGEKKVSKPFQSGKSQIISVSEDDPIIRQFEVPMREVPALFQLKEVLAYNLTTCGRRLKTYFSCPCVVKINNKYLRKVEYGRKDQLGTMRGG